MTVAGYTLTYQGLTQRQAANAQEFRAPLDVRRGDARVASLAPGKNNYPIEQQTSNEVAIYHDWRNAGDLFTIADQIEPGGAVYFKVFVKPLVNLIWLAGLIFVGGSLIALWPDPAEQRRLAQRYAPEAAAA